MTATDRRSFLIGLGAAVTLAPGVVLRPRPAFARHGFDPRLTRIDRDLLPSPEEAHAWHAAKDSKGGPTLAGSDSWRHFLGLVEGELRRSGVVDLLSNPWTYRRWWTSEWPDESGWSLHVDGERMKVASYGCNSGGTPSEGVTGELVVYRDGMQAAELQGKIAVVRKPGTQIRPGDYEYLANPETFPDPLLPRGDGGGLSPFPNMGLGGALGPLTEAGAAGALLVLDLSYDALAGTYTFPVPELHEMPTLYLDRETGVEVLAAASAGKSATLRLLAETEEVETYQLFAYLPGRHYGTPEDEQILLITHTDGPSISQENGAFGIAALVRYFSHVPRAARPRTLMVFLDCRHYMPGMERAFAEQDLAARQPDLYERVVAAMGIEHLGQIQVNETVERPYHLTDEAELSALWVTDQQDLIDLAIAAVKENGLRRVQVQCPGRPGIHGGEQGRWYGLGGIARRLGVPGASTMGTMTAYWSSKARLDYFDPSHFVDQVATMSQIAGELMISEAEWLGRRS